MPPSEPSPATCRTRRRRRPALPRVLSCGAASAPPRRPTDAPRPVASPQARRASRRSTGNAVDPRLAQDRIDLRLPVSRRAARPDDLAPDEAIRLRHRRADRAHSVPARRVDDVADASEENALRARGLVMAVTFLPLVFFTSPPLVRRPAWRVLAMLYEARSMLWCPMESPARKSPPPRTLGVAARALSLPGNLMEDAP